VAWWRYCLVATLVLRCSFDCFFDDAPRRGFDVPPLCLPSWCYLLQLFQRLKPVILAFAEEDM